MLGLKGNYIFKTGSPSVDAVGDYFLMTSGFWVQLLAGNLLAGPYKTSDGVAFTLVA